MLDAHSIARIAHDIDRAIDAAEGNADRKPWDLLTLAERDAQVRSVRLLIASPWLPTAESGVQRIKDFAFRAVIAALRAPSWTSTNS
jgi:hypothetical protein